jgi:alcohol dehydrogenase
MGYKKALIVTDGALSKMGLAKTVADKLAAQGISADVFDGVQPNPTVGNVNSGGKTQNRASRFHHLVGWWLIA